MWESGACCGIAQACVVQTAVQGCRAHHFCTRLLSIDRVHPPQVLAFQVHLPFVFRHLPTSPVVIPRSCTTPSLDESQWWLARKSAKPCTAKLAAWSQSNYLNYFKSSLHMPASWQYCGPWPFISSPIPISEGGMHTRIPSAWCSLLGQWHVQEPVHNACASLTTPQACIGECM